MTNRLLCAVAALLLFASGCANVPKQAFNAGANTHVKNVAILEPKETPDYEAVIMNHPGAAFGLVGALIAAGDMASKTKRFNDMMKPTNWTASVAVTNAVEAELRKAGYQVTRIPVTREKPALLESYKDVDLTKIKPAPDALLDLMVGAPGYIANTGTADYMPSLRVIARMVSAKDQSVIFHDYFMYGYAGAAYGRLEAITIASDQKYHFQTIDSLVESPEVPLEGLKAGIPPIAKRLAQELSHGGLVAEAGTAPGGAATSTEATAAPEKK